MSDDTGETDEERSARRSSLFITGTLEGQPGTAASTVRVRNLSAGGAMIEGYAQLSIGMSVRLVLTGIGPVEGTIAWIESSRAGVSFDHRIDPEQAKVKGEPAPRPPFDITVTPSTRRPGLKTS